VPRRIRSLLTIAALVIGVLCAGGIANAAVSPGDRADPGQPALTLRVVSYNIRHGEGEDGVFDPARTAAALRQLDADVIGLNEVDVHWGDRSDFLDEAGYFAQALGMHAYFGPIYDLPPLTAGAPDRLYGEAILSRYPIVHATNHDITRLSTQVPNPVPAPAPGFPEIVIATPGGPIDVYTTHLDYRADPAVRELQVADTLRIHGADPRRTILTGDFNAAPDAPELQPLWTELVDALGATANAGQFTYPANDPVQRIDYVAVSPDITVVDGFVPDIEFAGVQASDHRPVAVDLSVPLARTGPQPAG
jgi:endonuclease/exonuclease/phosphatase family metal-dependent hydrolase